MAFFHDGKQQGGSGGPYVKWVTKNNPCLSIRGVFPQVNAEVGKALMVVDFPTVRSGWGKFEGVPQIVSWPYRTQPLPQPIGYKKCAIFQALIVGHPGILPWATDSEYTMNRMGSYFEQYEAYPEAAQGKLPVYRYIGNDPHKHPSYPSDTFYVPRFEIVEWMPRPDEFGDPTVPPKPPELPEAEVPTALPPPANDTAPAAYRPVPLAEPTPPAPPSAPTPAAIDLLAKYVRRQ